MFVEVGLLRGAGRVGCGAQLCSVPDGGTGLADLFITTCSRKYRVSCERLLSALPQMRKWRRLPNFVLKLRKLSEDLLRRAFVEL